MKVLILDNYDSFTYNLAQYIGELGAEPVVYRNDELTVDEAWDLKPDRLVISPGPGQPEDAGRSVEFVETLGKQIPTLGVCLGLQAAVVAFGGSVGLAPEPRHGKTSDISHDGLGVFEGLPSPFVATRYHSLATVDLPACFVQSASSDDGVIQAIRHVDYPITGVQFHPESIMTEQGKALLANFLGQQPVPPSA